MTGMPKMDTAAFRLYFAPLEKWLTKHNKEKNNWVSSGASAHAHDPEVRGSNENMVLNLSFTTEVPTGAMLFCQLVILSTTL
jgi:hypothetical protein